MRRVTRSQILVGDGMVSVSVEAGGETTLEPGGERLARLVVRELPGFRVPARSEPVGRGGLVEQVAAELAAGRSVQLVGASGVGKGEVAAAVVRRLAAAGRPGAWLLAGGEPHDLESLYRRLAGLFFDLLWYQPDEAALREVTRRLRPRGIVVVTDCELAGETARLVESFPECVFLLTSTTPTLGDQGSVHEVAPLTPDEAGELVCRVLGRELRDAEGEQVRRAYELAGGRIAALVTCAAFLRRVADDPRRTELVALPPAEQAALLISGLDEPARRVLRALAAFGPASAGLFPMLADTAADAEGMVSRLAYAGLIREADEGYAAAEDAAALERRVTADQARHIGEGLRGVYETRGVSRPPAAFALEVVRALVAAESWDPASRLARAAAADAVGGGRVPAWSELIALGADAARAAGRRDDLRYFLRQQHTDALLRNAAAAAALLALALAELLRVPLAPTSAPAPHRPRVTRSLLHGARRAATVGHGVGAVAAAIVVAAVAGGVVGATQSPDSLSGGSGAQANAVPSTAPTWVITMSSTPLTPIPDAPGTIPAQFPLLTSGASPAARAKIDTQLQQPLRAELGAAYMTAKADQTVGLASAVSSGSAEKTSAQQAGALESVVYEFNSTAVYQAASAALLLRTDTGAIIPQSEILTARAETGAGAARLNAIVSSLLPASASIRTVMAVGCEEPLGDTFVAPAIAVTSSGLTFYISTDGLAGCTGDTAVAVPFNRLTGLVNPLIVQLSQLKQQTRGGA